MSEAKKEKPKHLGRGLQSLISPIIPQDLEPLHPGAGGVSDSNFPPDKELQESFCELDITTISANPYQARAVWDESELLELAESIKATGVIQPIIVRRVGAGYELIAGERRLRASKLAGLKVIPALVRQASAEQMHEWSLVENIHRSDLNPIERAKAYQRYLSAFSLSQTEAAERLGEDRSVVANYLRLLDLPEEIKQMLADGRLSMGHARAILGLPTDELRRKLANRALAGRLSVREVERLVRKYLAGQERGAPGSQAKPPHIIDLENQLSRQLGTRVTIETRKRGHRGKIVIEFYSLDEFDRLTERIGVACGDAVGG